MDYNWYKLFMEKVEEEYEKMPNANIMIVGKTGVGKSTLINNVFRDKMVETGIGRPITQHISKISKEGIPLCVYDTKGLELNSQVQEDIKKEIVNQIELTLKSTDQNDYIHAMWFCINANSNRIEDFEIEWIHEFSQRLPVILVLTQCIGSNYKALESFVTNLNLPVMNVIPVLAEKMQITDEILLPAFGLERLVDVTNECLEVAQKKAFINAQKISIDKKVSMARKAVLPYVSGNFVTGFTPIPFADAAVLVPSQIGMIAQITVIFGLDFDKSFILAIVSAIGGTGGAVAIGRTIVGNAFKFIPGIGTILGGTIQGTTAGIITAALGYAYIEVLSKYAARLYEGEEVKTNILMDAMQKAFIEQLKKGKKILK